MPEDPTTASPVVIYDGVCHLCNGSVAFIIRKEMQPVLKFAPGQSAFARNLLDSSGDAVFKNNSIILVDCGNLLFKSDAALRIAAYMRWPWSLLRFLRIIPRRIRDWVYDRIAANRYRLFGKSESCLVPDKSIQHRFIGLDGDLSS